MGNDAVDHGRAPFRPGTRVAILGYYENGANLVTMAMNGWSDGEPAWWLNLQAQPDATVVLAGGSRDVRGRAALGDERARLWARWREMGDDVDGYAKLRSTETAVVVLEPRAEIAQRRAARALTPSKIRASPNSKSATASVRGAALAAAKTRAAFGNRAVSITRPIVSK